MRWLVLLWLLLAVPARADLEEVVLVLDPGHGDRAWGEVMADPGACAESIHGTAWECCFTWDTAMRLKRAAEARGAQVFLTLQDPRGDYRPRPWSPDSFPDVTDGSFAYKSLVEVPEPSTVEAALWSRAATANRVYREHPSKRVYFLSLHFDSTAPELAGISFYYPTWEGSGGSFVAVLQEEIRLAGRQRASLHTGRERGLAQPHAFAVLSQSENPDSYLIELGNIRSRDAEGKNPDLWRMRSPETRQAYAELILRAAARDAREPRGRAPGKPPIRLRWILLSALALTIGLWMLADRLRKRAPGAAGTEARSANQGGL
ncbi:MAG: N-acetylmuramoyl-L-alanine amidase [Candidatus Eremiobacterota bacterium]